MRLEGKVALISGAATGVEGELMGFGGAAARLFAREGAKVVLGDIKQEQGERTTAQIREAGGEAMFVPLDVTHEGDWIDAIQATVAAYGKPGHSGKKRRNLGTLHGGGHHRGGVGRSNGRAR